MRVLVIEDDPRICEAICFAMKHEGYDVDICQDGEEGILWMLLQKHDIVLLDRMLPKVDGITVLNTARAKGINTPIMLLTVIGESKDIVEGLNAGADDYLIKPFDMVVLLARIRACARRPRDWWPDAIVTYKDMKLNVKARILEWRDISCELSTRETTLFEVLMKNKGSVVRREDIFDYIWGIDADVDQGILDSYIRHARNRLKAMGCTIEIRTIRYTGYCLKG